MREVKEVRVGKCFKDFDRWPEESGRVDAARCFIVLYGSEFKLKTLSIAGKKSLANVPTYYKDRISVMHWSQQKSNY